MTSVDELEPRRTAPELRAERLAFALRSLAAELVDERRKVAELRREVARLSAQLESLRSARRGDEAITER